MKYRQRRLITHPTLFFVEENPILKEVVCYIDTKKVMLTPKSTFTVLRTSTRICD